jgi:DNA replication ATP-dependent helicase Dna2
MPYHNPKLNEEQNRIINKALDAEDYFLLVGPPGTGKTSLILRNLTYELYENSTSNILLLAYTNRAVDEICEAIRELDFLRIGSEYSTAEAHRPKLLDKKIEQQKDRKEVRELMSKTRIFVATVAAVSNKPEIFELKKFNVAIIDEASQILEPQIIGILPLVEKFVMIGDHKQLPAIVLQNSHKSKTQDVDLEAIGLHNRSNSLFERLYNLCKLNDWHWAYDTLTFQGRMHIELADFPNKFFYEGVLKPARPEQTLDFEEDNNKLASLALSKRLLFIPTQRVAEDKSDKINSQEAQITAKLVRDIIEVYRKQNKPFIAEKSVGIITPYRNQIAHIRNYLQQESIENYEKITVDTVERYQGSQRDIIIISFCINSLYQMKNLVSITDDGITDRKLNVALTRAREQMILLGNIELLATNPIYAALIAYCKERYLLIEFNKF